MGLLMQRLLSPPDMPLLDLPVAVRWMPGVKQAVGEVCKTFYYLGAVDGFAIGMALAVAIILGLQNRGNATGLASTVVKGVTSVLNAI